MVALILCTYGGDASAAYRIARCLQQKYEKFTVWIGGSCKSAGTLLAIGAHEIVMADHGELGPLDVQVGKKDELGEMDSGLTVLNAINTLEEKCFELFETCFLNLKNRSAGRITLKTAMDLASKLAIGTITPIVGQIDPMNVGEVSRAMNIGLQYGHRLAQQSKNVKGDALQTLTNDYPSHGFVIDCDETKQLFVRVREPGPEEQELLDMLGEVAREPQLSPIIFNVWDSPNEGAYESDNRRDSSRGSAEIEAGVSGAAETIAGGGSSQLTHLEEARSKRENSAAS